MSDIEFKNHDVWILENLRCKKEICKMLNGRKNKLRVKIVQVHRFSKYIYIVISSFNKQSIQNIVLKEF